MIIGSTVATRRSVSAEPARPTRTTAAGDAPEARVAAYVTAQLEMVRDGEHRIARAAADPAALRAGADAAHRALLTPLTTALHDLGDTTPLRTAHLLQGFVNAATTPLNRATTTKRSPPARSAWSWPPSPHFPE